MQKEQQVTAPSAASAGSDARGAGAFVAPSARPGMLGFRAAKRLLDISVSLAGIALLLPLVPVLLAANRRHNPGPLLYRQARMGRGCATFTVLKFRTMAPGGSRAHDEPLETDRITPLGRFMRRTRIDELPQLVNVLRGEMSLIGPRPDPLEHAAAFMEAVPGYRERHAVRPGLSGLAQTSQGYIVGIEAAKRKVELDLAYVRGQGWALEARLLWRTLKVLRTGFGAR